MSWAILAKGLSWDCSQIMAGTSTDGAGGLGQLRTDHVFCFIFTFSNFSMMSLPGFL